jgi:mono/diheme cytochrome c family protein
MSARMRTPVALAALLFASGPVAAQPAADGSFQRVDKFMERDGEAVFVHVCAGCHMPDGKGAVGAARYPALAANPKLAARAYAVLMVVQGRGAMPSFAQYLDDAQIAGVVNYVRTHFGNNYADAVGAADARSARP